MKSELDTQMRNPLEDDLMASGMMSQNNTRILCEVIQPSEPSEFGINDIDTIMTSRTGHKLL